MENLLVVSHEWNLGFEELRELANAAYQVIPAASGFDAVKIFATRPIAAVVVNRSLPDMDVADFAGYIHKHNESLPIVMLSAVMPVLEIPEGVDAVIAKHDCSTLLVPTLQLASRRIGGDECLAQTA